MWQKIIKFIVDWFTSKPDVSVTLPETIQIIEPTESTELTEPNDIEPQPFTVVKEEHDISMDIKIIEDYLPPKEYINESTSKNAIVLHHTVSPSNSAVGDIQWWKTDPRRVGAHFIIDRFGNIYQCVPLDKWIHHLGVTMSSNRISFRYRTNELNDKYNSQTIGIELDSAGGLISRNNKWISSYNQQIPEKDVWKTKNYRGYTGFETYHPAQLESLKKLILYLMEKYPVIKEGLNNDFTKIFDINLDALNSKPGIYSHTSYRTDKSDCAPQPELIKMLNSLKDEVRSNSSEA